MLGWEIPATRLLSLDSRSRFPSTQGGAAQQVSLVPWRGGAEGPCARPRPSSGPALSMTIGRSTRGRGRAGAGGARGGRPRVSLPPSRGCGARRLGWLGRTWVPTPAPSFAMGNSHHKRKAPSGPRTRSFWRFGRSAKRPAGRGGGGAGGEEGPCSLCRRCAVPSRGLVGVRVGGRGSVQIPPLT